MSSERKKLTKQQLVGLLVYAMDESDFVPFLDLPESSCEICDSGDVPLVRRISSIVSELLDTFDYSKSPEFVRSITCRSAEYRAMKLKLITPMRHAENRERFVRALMDVIDSDAVFDLVEDGRRERIAELRTLLTEISNPSAPE